jgi:hypothetical protein
VTSGINAAFTSSPSKPSSKPTNKTTSNQ